MLLCAVQCCSVVQCGSALFSLVPYHSVLFSVVMCGSVLCRTGRFCVFVFFFVHLFIAVPGGLVMFAAAPRCPVLFTDVDCCLVFVSAVQYFSALIDAGRRCSPMFSILSTCPILIGIVPYN